MKMMDEKNIEKLLGWAKETKKIFESSGETEFDELKKREKKQILELIDTFDLNYDIDGCGDYMSQFIGGDNYDICFFSMADYVKDFDNYAYAMRIRIGGRPVSLDSLIAHLSTLLYTEVTIINLTHHTVTFYASDGETILKTVPSSGIARVAQIPEIIGELNGIPVCKISYSDVDGLPDPAPNTIYIVSAPVAQAAYNRNDLYIVNDIVRNLDRKIPSYKGLVQI